MMVESSLQSRWLNYLRDCWTALRETNLISTRTACGIGADESQRDWRASESQRGV